jgi:hypothetical protein
LKTPVRCRPDQVSGQLLRPAFKRKQRKKGFVAFPDHRLLVAPF